MVGLLMRLHPSDKMVVLRLVRPWKNQAGQREFDKVRKSLLSRGNRGQHLLELGRRVQRRYRCPRRSDQYLREQEQRRAAGLERGRMAQEIVRSWNDEA